MEPHLLPVYRQKDRILKALEKSQVIVVESPTGSGKTTQIPIILYQAGYAKEGILGITQPRRIAAISVSEYITRSLKQSPSSLVNYKIRFEDHTTPETRIKIMTDGILLQELKHDPLLSAYSVLMIDEAHERSLNIDFILGLLKQILDKRKDLKVIVSSATINAEVFSEYFGECPILRIESEVYPVELVYDPPALKDNYEELINKIASLVEGRKKKGITGDLLIFLPGERAIKDCLQALSSLSDAGNLHLLPLYGRLGKEEQEKVFLPTPAGKTKVVVSTNIAETSVTIDGITMVIDSGLAKINYYSPKSFTEALIESPISKASSNQRKGRAGRTQPGICYRLYEKEDFNSRPLFTLDEIYRTDLSEVVLRMSELGIRDFESFDFISPPSKESLRSAVKTLRLLKALSPDNSLSEIGVLMAYFPLLPRLSRMIVEAIYNYPTVIKETIVASAFLSTPSPFLLPQEEEIEARKAHRSFSDPLGDFVSYLKILDAFRKSKDKEKFCRRNYLDIKVLTEIDNISLQLGEIVSSLGVPLTSGGSLEDYLCAVAGGLLQYVCIRQSFGVYRSSTAQRISIHPGSVLFRESPQYIVAGEIVKTSRMYARSVSPLKKGWIPRISPWLAENLLGMAGEIEKAKGKPRETRSRETTPSITLGNMNFELRNLKGKKKAVILPLEDLFLVLKRYTSREGKRFKSLRTILTYKGEELLTGIKLPKALAIARRLYSEDKPFIDTPEEINKKYKAPQDILKILGKLPLLLKISPFPGPSKKAGFVSLETDGQGLFWLSVRKNFYQALGVSIASLEILGESEGADPVIRRRINKAYRNFTELLEV